MSIPLTAPPSDLSLIAPEGQKRYASQVYVINDPDTRIARNGDIRITRNGDTRIARATTLAYPIALTAPATDAGLISGER